MKIGHLNGQWKSKEVAKLQCEEEVIRREIQSNLDHVTHKKERITGQIQREKKRFSALQTHHLYHFPRFHLYVLIYNICFSLSDLLHSLKQALSSSTSIQLAQIFYFLWLSNIPFFKHICTRTPLSIYLSMNIQVVSMPWLMEIVLL